MSGKRKRCESSWDMKQDKMMRPPPEKELNSKSSDPPGRPCWEGKKNDDISRDRRTFDDEWERPYTTRLPYRDGSRSPNRSRSREWESRGPFSDDRHKSTNKYDVRNESRPCKDFTGDRNLKESRSRRPDDSGGPRYSRFPHHRDEEDGRRQSNSNSNQISKIPCRFFAVGNCTRDNCRFSHHLPNSHPQRDDRSSPDNIPGATSEKKKSSWDSGGFDDTNEKKKSSWDDVSNPKLDNKNRSWDGPSWDEVDASNNPCHSIGSRATKSHEKTDSWNGNDYLLPKQHNQDNQQFLTSGQGKVSPKKKQQLVEVSEQEEEEESINPEKPKDQNRTRSRSRSRSPFRDDRHKSTNQNGRNDDDDVRNWSKDFGDCRKGGSHSCDNRNSRNHYDDDDDDRDGRRQSNRTSRRIQCKFFAAGRCNRDDCNFSHDVPDSHHHHDKWQHDRKPHSDLNASDLSEKNKSWNGPFESGGFVERSRNNTLGHTSDDKNKSWDGFNENKWDSHNSNDMKKSPQKDVSNPNLDYKNGSWNGPSWDEVDGAKLGNNNIDEKTKSWVQMDDEKGCEKNDYFLPQQHDVVNDSHINNGSILSEEVKQQIPSLYTEQNLTNAIDYLNSLPNSTRPKEADNIGNDVMENENPKQKVGNENRVAEKAKQEQGKVKEGNIGNDEKCMRQFRTALLEFVKEILKPKWKEGKMTREVYKSVVRKVVDKITTTIQIPKTQAKIELYLTHSKPKIKKLVEAYIEKLAKV